MPDPGLELRDIRVDIGGTPYVRGVSLTVGRGQTLGLLGPNGAGKTTLMRVIYTSARPDHGEVLLEGRPKPAWRRTDWARKVGALVQGEGLLAGLTPEDIVDIGLRPLGLPPQAHARRRDAALDDVGLLHKRRQGAENLSGGERQRCYFAQLLARDPEVYILDEPANHLDLHFQLKLLDEIRRRGRIALASFHDLSLASRYCDQVAIMEHGEIAAAGPPRDVLTRAQIARSYRVAAQLQDHALHIDGPILTPPARPTG